MEDIKNPRDSSDGTITAPGLPKTVRVWGKVILIWNTVALVLSLVLVVLGLAHDNKTEIIQGGAQAVAAYLFFKCSRGLVAARRGAVFGMTALCLIALVWAVMFHRQDVLTPFGGIRAGIFVPLVIAILYLPPLCSAFRHWRRFH